MRTRCLKAAVDDALAYSPDEHPESLVLVLLRLEGVGLAHAEGHRKYRYFLHLGERVFDGEALQIVKRSFRGGKKAVGEAVKQLSIRRRVRDARAVPKAFPLPDKRFPNVGVATDVDRRAIDARLTLILGGSRYGVVHWRRDGCMV